MTCAEGEHTASRESSEHEGEQWRVLWNYFDHFEVNRGI